MKEMIRITISLVTIFLAAGLIMGGTYKVTSPVKYKAEKREKEEALREMAPEATDPITAAGTWESHGKRYEYYVATTGGRPVAYLASTAGKGYSSFVKMLISLDRNMHIRNVKILGHGETPGLGDLIEEPEFLNQFAGKSLSQLVLVKKETADNIQAISGATISSRAVTNGVKDAVQMLVDTYGAGIAASAKGAGK